MPKNFPVRLLNAHYDQSENSPGMITDRPKPTATSDRFMEAPFGVPVGRSVLRFEPVIQEGKVLYAEITISWDTS